MTSKFKRLLSNLPFNPSLIGKVSFYSKRLRQEASIRRLGFAFIALAMFVQTIAVISPPQSSIAQSDNDLISGGFGSTGQAVDICNNNVGGFRDIAAHFGISCGNIASASTVTIRSNDYDGKLYSMGRLPYGKAGETPVTIGATTYWLRFLWSWDSLGYPSTYTALRGTSSSGQTFFILFDCGNFVFIGLPPPPPPKPVCPGWYQGWGFWYQSPDGDVNHATKTTTTNPCVAAPPPPKAPPCPYNPNINKDDPACKPCEDSQTQDDKTACLAYSKKARNETQNIDDANSTTAQAGDVITYTLTVKNKGKADIDNVVIQENISDILDYADVVDLKGGTKDNRNIVSWPKQKIKAGSEINQQFVVKVKNPIPQTPVSSSDPGHFDLTMTNVYGNTVNIKLPPTVIKTTETIVRTMPNTGPGTSLIAGFALTVVVAYFFMRSRLMSKELDLVRAEYNATGSL